jgi:hypothetical protein
MAWNLPHLSQGLQTTGIGPGAGNPNIVAKGLDVQTHKQQQVFWARVVSPCLETQKTPEAFFQHALQAAKLPEPNYEKPAPL